MELFNKEDVLLKILYSGLFDDCRIESVRNCLESIPAVEAVPISELRKNLVNCTNKINIITSIVRNEYIPKAEYETRLNADMVAMLTGIEDKIKHCDLNGLWKPNYKEGFNDGVAKCCSIIHQEINNLQVNNSKVKEQDDAEI